MDLRRLRAGELIAAAAGAVTLVSLFVPWYDAEPGPAASDLASTLSGWESLAVIDVILALIAVAAILLAAVTASQERARGSDRVLGSGHARGNDRGRARPLPRPGPPRRSRRARLGLWLGLAGTAAIAAGGALAMRDERLSPPGRQVDLTGRPAPPRADPRADPRAARRGWLVTTAPERSSR